MTHSIREATVADLPAMMALEKRAATAAHWTGEQYEALFRASHPERVALILEESADFRDLSLPAWWPKNGRSKISPSPVLRGARGLGTRLLGELLDLARKKGAAAVFLEVRESNRAARVLYEKWAFLESGRRRRYYKDPEEDAILYRIDFI